MNLKSLIKPFLCTAAALLMLTVSAFADNNTGVVTGDVVNIRAGRGTDTEILTQVYKGEKYSILGIGNLWTEIEYIPGKTGFIYNTYFKPAAQKGTVTGSYVNIRESASTDAKILGGALRGTVLTVKSVKDAWVEVEYNSITGWMHGDYVRVGDEETVSYNAATAENVLAEAAKYNGLPYVYGATGPYAFDCSGFTQYVFNKFGVTLPRVAASQASVGYAVSKADLMPGDLVFFQNGGYIDHVGIYVGNGQMIHAGSSRSGVCYASINCSYFGPRYAGARRVI